MEGAFKGVIGAFDAPEEGLGDGVGEGADEGEGVVGAEAAADETDLVVVEDLAEGVDVVGHVVGVVGGEVVAEGLPVVDGGLDVGGIGLG